MPRFHIHYMKLQVSALEGHLRHSGQHCRQPALIPMKLQKLAGEIRLAYNDVQCTTGFERHYTWSREFKKNDLKTNDFWAL